MKGIFVTGTDTGVGKTTVCGMLGRFFSDKGYKVITQKWMQTGSGGFPRDIDLHLEWMKRRRRDIKDYLPYISPYVFKFPASPHLSARLEKRAVNVVRMEKSFKFLSKRFDFVIVEGIGGALVPFSQKRLVIDIAKKLNLPVLIVAANKLGAINHTLLTVEAIKRRNMRIIGIIFNNLTRGVNKVILKDNPQIIERISKEKILGVLPHSKERERLYKSFIPLGNRIKIKGSGLNI